MKINKSKLDLTEEEIKDLSVYEIFTGFVYFAIITYMMVDFDWTVLVSMPYFFVGTLYMVIYSYRKEALIRNYKEKTNDGYPLFLNNFNRYFGMFLCAIFLLGTIALIVPALRDWLIENIFV